VSDDVKVEESKVCNECFEEKLLSEFHTIPLVNGGIHFRNKCKDCRRAASRAYNKKHREACLKRTNEWRKNNPERRKESARKWYKKNAESRIAYSTNWIKNNPEKHRQYTKTYYIRKKALNPE
jgi:HSP90 family molecular chaperone